MFLSRFLISYVIITIMIINKWIPVKADTSMFLAICGTASLAITVTLFWYIKAGSDNEDLAERIAQKIKQKKDDTK